MAVLEFVPNEDRVSPPRAAGFSLAVETLSPRSGAPCVFHPFPALTRWAIFFRPTDSGRAKIIAGCEELAVA